MLQKSLKVKRYLIVLVDMWKTDAWDDVRLCFPNENKGSGILLTTRNNEVACYAATENRSLMMGFMDQDESWNLFKSAAFSNEALPYEFQTVGKKIADECHGVLLTIIVVAGLLKSKWIIEDWKSVAKDVKSFVTNDPDEQCSRVLGLSYNHLTRGLKTCLLYFGIFSEDTEIPVKRLMGLWIADGFLNLENDLEGEAEKCLQDLINRCLVVVSKKSRDETKIISCKEVIMGIQKVKKLGINGDVDGRECFKEWYPNVGGFTRLKLLLIEENYLKRWKAANDNFPVLECLLLRYCFHLKETPIEFAEIHSLQLIELDRCLHELGESATRIQQEQEELRNNPMDDRIFNPCKSIFIKIKQTTSKRKNKNTQLYVEILAGKTTGKGRGGFTMKGEEYNVERRNF
ncbi:hypothetical protein CQW23_06293 [Capsicum baccatum]|uniref:Uncharacterized protein n=1 Tax=Capsicum baccatum TaxID=33114 RepID=A0A2G2X302_CAPBA|nr:hypothetical protein CQW23_06293 [Capsicum baccatum]